jgi:hypothetical protein
VQAPSKEHLWRVLFYFLIFFFQWAVLTPVLQVWEEVWAGVELARKTKVGDHSGDSRYKTINPDTERTVSASQFSLQQREQWQERYGA